MIRPLKPSLCPTSLRVEVYVREVEGQTIIPTCFVMLMGVAFSEYGRSAFRRFNLNLGMIVRQHITFRGL